RTSPSAVMLLVPVPPLTTSVAVTEPIELVRLKPVLPTEAPRVSPLAEEVLTIVTLPVSALAVRLSVLVVTEIDPPVDDKVIVGADIIVLVGENWLEKVPVILPGVRTDRVVAALMVPVPDCTISPFAVMASEPSDCNSPLTCKTGPA